jgi:hypothetical protein
MKTRNYAKEYADFHGRPSQIKKRNNRNRARTIMKKKYGAKAIKGKDIHHNDFNANNNKLSNLSIMSKSKNRSMNKPFEKG